MKILNKAQFKKLMERYLNGGIVFAEYEPDVYSELQVTDGWFGATTVVPYHGEVYKYDWNIEESTNEDLFMVFDNNDILQMIKTLTSGLSIDLKDDED